MFHRMRPKFIWNFDISVNIPGDAEHGNACLCTARFGSDWFTLVWPRFNTKEAFGSCGVNTAVTVWFCVFHNPQNRSFLPALCALHLKKKRIWLFNPHLLQSYQLQGQFLKISFFFFFFFSNSVPIEISSGGCVFSFNNWDSYTHSMGQRLASGREGILPCVDFR